MKAAEELVALAARLGAARRMAGIARLVGLAALGYGAGTLLGAALPLAAAGLVAGAVMLWDESRQRLTPRVMADHLDRRVPEFEESTTLLLADPAGLTAVARLQRERILSRWSPERVAAAIPTRARRRTALGAGLAILGVLFASLARIRPVEEAIERAAAVVPRTAPEVRRLELLVQPPSYTGLRAHAETGDELIAEEGARLEWRVRVAGDVTGARLLFSTGDTLPLRQDGGEWTAPGTAAAPALVRLSLTERDGAVHLGADRRLAVRPDRPPVVTLVQPTGRTEFRPGTEPTVLVEVLATDDYGIAEAQLAVTLASGRGEQVKFERRSLPFTGREARPGGGLRLTTTLRLGALGLGPGDELYFHAEAADRRTPVPGRGRSETAFLVIRDTSEVPKADFSGLVLAAEPEYFRSQRQVILDTEKLLADQARLPAARFGERSNEIGIDQGLLRLRYGQFLGEEFEEGVVPEGGEGEAHPEDQPADTPPDAKPDPLAGDVHRHDDAENATLLGASVKTRLKAAVNAMWQAELHLRTHEPARALPFEYRALELLKSVQQESRAYVQRVGFEPPPIDQAALRLTGKVDEVESRTRERRITAGDSLAPLRRALSVAATGADLGELRGVGDGLAAFAVNEPRLLPALHALRRLSDSLAAGRECGDCRAEIARRIYPLLPAPEPRLGPSVQGHSPLAERYLLRLHGEAP